MRISIIILSSLTAIACGDSYLFTIPAEPDLSKARIEDEKMHIIVQVKRLPNPKVGGIEVEPNEKGDYVVRTYVEKIPERGWFPMIKLEDRIVEISSITNNGPNFASYFEITFKDKDQAIAMAKSLASLFGVPDQRVVIGDKKAEPVGGDQPATAPESKSEGKQKPEPESKVRPR